MEVRQLRYLVALADERHFTRAAVRANVAQPALSRQIRNLEAELGVPLVDRTSRRVRMTPAGERLIARARRVIAEIDAARDEAQDQQALLRGRVDVGISTTPGPVDLAALLADFHRAHSAIELGVRDGLSVELVAALLADELDAAFVTTSAAPSRGQLELTLLARERLVLAVGDRHALAVRKRIALARLRDERFVAFPAGATIRTSVTLAARTAGFEPQVAFEISDLRRALAIVARGLAVAVLPESQINGVRGITGVRLDAGLVHSVYLARRAARALSPAARAFESMTLATLAD